MDPSKLSNERPYFEALLNICDRFEDGLEGHLVIVVKEFLEEFLTTENYFQDISYDSGVSTIKSNVENFSNIFFYKKISRWLI